jgi:CBS-domain-containing membrane protein
MRSPPQTIPGSTPVAMITERTDLEGRDIVFPVTDDGRMIGLVRMSELEKIPPERRWVALMRDQASPLTDAEKVTPQDSAIAALRRLARARGNQAFVLHEDGRIAGWISAYDIFAFMESRDAAMQAARSGQAAG